MDDKKTIIIFVVSLIAAVLLWGIVWFSIHGYGYKLHDKNMPCMMGNRMNAGLQKNRILHQLTGSSLPADTSSTKPISWEQGPNLPENQLQENTK